jgi:hypothetical protein
VIPRLLTVRVKHPGGRPIRIWLPVLPLVLLFLPLVVAAALAGLVACVIYRINVPRAALTGWRVASALRGTRIDIEQGRTAVLVAIS